MKKLGILLLAAILVFITWGGLISRPVSSQIVQSRLNNLESDFSRLESRLNRIESQLRQSGVRVPTNRSGSTDRKARPSQIQGDQMFDNLATLAIELKQDVRKLEKRVSKLESPN